MEIKATGLPKTIEDYQVALNAAFAGGRAFGEVVMQGRAIKLAMAEANDKRLEALAQPEQEPVAWMNKDGWIGLYKQGDANIPLYTTPLQRKELTDEINRLRKALVYVAHSLHATPQYMLAKGITLLDGDAVRVSIDGCVVEASDKTIEAAHGIKE